jgi:hypothetical protein
MTTKTISAAANPALANNMIQQAMTEKPVDDFNPEIKSPLDNMVNLPGGFITPAGEVLRVAEVRELTGRDEEAIARSSNIGKALLTILQLGTVKIGDLPADESVLDNLLSGDLDAILLGIIKTTFGKTTDIPALCNKCQEYKVVTVDLDDDIKSKVLIDPINDRVFTVEGKRNIFTVRLPSGYTQKQLINNADKNDAEQITILLESTVLKIDDNPIYNKVQVQNLSISDRQKIVEQLNTRVAGPQFTDVTVTCPDCEGEVTVSINLGTLFRI